MPGRGPMRDSAPPSPLDPRGSTSSGPPSRGSTMPTGTATWCAPALRWRPSTERSVPRHLAVGLDVQQTVDLPRVGELDPAEPALPVGIGVDELGLLSQGAVHL